MHTIDVDRDIMEVNREIALRNREHLEENGVYGFNIMGAVGSGKTIMIERLVEGLRDEFRIGVIAGDVVSDMDVRRIERLKIPVRGVNTGRECHLDAHLIEHSLGKLPLDDIDLLPIENVGNLICPVDFKLGVHKKIVVVSVTEGGDTIEKHPMIFVYADACVINKVDIADAVDADVEKMAGDARRINPELNIFRTSFKTGEGVDELVEWVRRCVI